MPTFQDRFRKQRAAYNEAEQFNIMKSIGSYNDFNLQVTREQSKINALKQELQFKTNQLT